MSESLFNEDGTFKSKAEILRIHEESQWKLIKEKIDRSQGQLRAIEFLNNGGVFKNNANRLKEAGYEVYSVRDSFSVTFNEDFSVSK